MQTRTILMAAFVLLIAAKEPARAQVRPDVIEANGKAVGMVATLDAEGNYQEKYSCFFVSPNGVLVTAYGAISEAAGIEVILPDGTKSRDVSVLNVDPRKDIAILRVPASGIPEVTLGDSDKTRTGDAVVVLSRPQATFTYAAPGIISALRDSMRGLRLHQLSAIVHRTGIGGPAVNERGEIIGMVSFYRLFGDTLGFVVPMNYIRGLIAAGSGSAFADFAKKRQPIQPFDPALIEAKRLAVIDRVKVSSFQLRDTRVKWEQINETIAKLRSELNKELNSYGSTASEIFLADPFEVAEHRRLIANLYFNFGEIFAVKDVAPNTLMPITASVLGAAPPSTFERERPLYGKKGENKGKVTRVSVTTFVSDFLPLFAAPAGTVVPSSATMQLAALISRTVSTEDMPNLSIDVYFADISDQGKEKQAESMWSQDAYTLRWDEVKDKRLWDLPEKVRNYRQELQKVRTEKK